ncbi:MAG TPA: protein kinase [Pyrinomonadaceae bacterium]|nr:protein kinase [Pyrinomonadaceae bacterium]
MIKCPECSSEISENESFCPFCGISLQAAVPPHIDEPDLADDSFESTIMMPPEEIAKLAEPVSEIQAELASEGESPTADANDSELSRKDNAPADEEPHSQAEAAGSAPVSSSSDMDVPVPGILSDIVNTSGSIETRSTSEYAPGEFQPEPEGMNAGASETAEGNKIEEVASPGEGELARSEGQAEERRAVEAASAGSDDSTGDDEIIRPMDELEPHDPFKSSSMFDSVRIMESEIPDIQENVDTMLGIPRDFSTPGARGVPSPVNETPAEIDEIRQQTSPGMGENDTDGRRSAKLKPLSEGTVLNSRYEIIRKIGGGGMGAVYLASDNNLGGVLRAVKEMVQAHIEDEQQEKAINDFKRESMILSTLDHPSIPTIFDYFYDEPESRFYLVMKYISGGDLSSRLRAAPEGKLDEKTVTEWAIQIADVLDYLHNQPSTIVYRDLKPSNIMVDGNSGRVMLIDFGIARSISQKEEKGVTAVGTMGYAPPELFSGNVEPRSDIYSLGSTMFHLLTGADPQSNPLLIFDFQKNPRPRQINPRLSDQMERILMRSVEYSAEARFSSSAEMRRVLQDHLDALSAGDLSFGVSAAPEAVSLANQYVFCGFCGQRIVATDLFCAFCGSKQPLAQQGVHSDIYSKPGATAKLFVEGTNELTVPTFSLQKDENLVGRRDPMSNIFPEVDLSKYDPQTKISRRHARIWRDGTNYLVEDLGSSNGTVLAGAAKDSIRLVPHRPHAISSGDKLKIGDTTLHFLVG